MKSWVKGGIVGLLVYGGLVSWWLFGNDKPGEIIFVMWLYPGILAQEFLAYFGVHGKVA